MKFIEVLRKFLEDEKLDLNFGISKLECSGLVLRILGNLTQEIERGILICHNHIRKELLGSKELFIRKY